MDKNENASQPEALLTNAQRVTQLLKKEELQSRKSLLRMILFLLILIDTFVGITFLNSLGPYGALGASITLIAGDVLLSCILYVITVFFIDKYAERIRETTLSASKNNPGPDSST